MAVLPCAAGRYAVQPCEAETQRISRSRRRKMRDRRVAIRHALCHSSNLKCAAGLPLRHDEMCPPGFTQTEQTSNQKGDGCLDVPVTAFPNDFQDFVIQSLEIILERLALTCYGFREPITGVYQSTYDTDDPCSNVLDCLKQRPSTVQMFNPNAPEFVPTAGAATTQCATFLSGLDSSLTNNELCWEPIDFTENGLRQMVDDQLISNEMAPTEITRKDREDGKNFMHLPSVGTWCFPWYTIDPKQEHAAPLTEETGETAPIEITRKDREIGKNFAHLPSVGTWCFPLHTIDSKQKHAAPFSEETWTESQTGEYVMRLKAEYQSRGYSVESYGILERGIHTATQHCPESNVPWLQKFLDSAKGDLRQRLRQSHQQQSDCIDVAPIGVAAAAAHVGGPVPDQEWHDEARARWWHSGRVVCYYCGCSDCEDTAEGSCERRRREVLGITADRRRRRRK